MCVGGEGCVWGRGDRDERSDHILYHRLQPLFAQHLKTNCSPETNLEIIIN